MTKDIYEQSPSEDIESLEMSEASDLKVGAGFHRFYYPGSGSDSGVEQTDPQDE